MKRLAKILIVLLVLVILMAEYSCNRNCRYMRYYKRDVKHGLAH